MQWIRFYSDNLECDLAKEPDQIDDLAKSVRSNWFLRHPPAMMLLLAALDSASTWMLIHGLRRGAFNALNRYHPHALIIRPCTRINIGWQFLHMLHSVSF